jgi:hypothetical protein
MVELDHLFVRVERGAPEAEVLRRAGVVGEGRLSRHPHQGTASKAFVFAGGYLELIWVEDEALADHAFGDLAFATRPCRFGVGYRRCGDGKLPFDVHPFAPDPNISIAESSRDVRAPITFVVPDAYAFRGGEGARIARFEVSADLLEIFLSGDGAEERLDFRPALPLVIVRRGG